MDVNMADSRKLFDRALFEFELLEGKRVCLQCYFGRLFGQGLTFDIVDDGGDILLEHEKTIWVS